VDGKRIAAAVFHDQAVVQDKLVFMSNFFFKHANSSPG
jgi:hypothetical protein